MSLERIVEDSVKPVNTTFSVEYKDVAITISLDLKKNKVSITPTKNTGYNNEGFVFKGSKPELVTDVARALIIGMEQVKQMLGDTDEPSQD